VPHRGISLQSLRAVYPQSFWPPSVPFLISVTSLRCPVLIMMPWRKLKDLYVHSMITNWPFSLLVCVRAPKVLLITGKSPSSSSCNTSHDLFAPLELSSNGRLMLQNMHMLPRSSNPLALEITRTITHRSLDTLIAGRNVLGSTSPHISYLLKREDLWKRTKKIKRTESSSMSLTWKHSIFFPLEKSSTISKVPKRWLVVSFPTPHAPTESSPLP